MFSKHLLINLSPQKICQKFAQFELWRAPDSIIKTFSKWDKHTLALIKNDNKIVWGNLEIPFLSWVIFNIVFSHEKTGNNSDQNEVSQKGNINRKKASCGFFPKPQIFKLQQVLKFNDICLIWSSPKINLETNFSKFGERQFFSIGTAVNIWHSFTC